MREDGQRTGNILGKVPAHGGILLYDDMEGVRKWDAVPGFKRATIGRTIDSAFQGNYGLRLTTYIRRVNGFGWAYAGRSFGRTSHKVMEASCVFRFPAVSPSPDFTFMVRRDDSDLVLYGMYRGTLGSLGYGWHRIIMTLDWGKGLYGPCHIDGFDIGLEGDPLLQWPSSGSEVMWVMLGCSAVKPFSFESVNYDLVLVRNI